MYCIVAIQVARPQTLHGAKTRAAPEVAAAAAVITTKKLLNEHKSKNDS